MTRVELVSLLGACLLPLIVLELVRRRRLQERYSLLWLLTGLVIVLLAAWPTALAFLARWMGIATPANALFVILGAFIVVVLLHYSTVISRLSQENTRLAQHVGLLHERVRDLEGGRPARDATRTLQPADDAPEPVVERRVAAISRRRR